MKKLSILILILLLLVTSGCVNTNITYDIVASTLPVYDFTSFICNGTPLTVGKLVTESISCLHDYSMQVSQMRMIENADAIVISGLGLEDFMDDVLVSSHMIIDSSLHTHTHDGEHSHEHHVHDDAHNHEQDPHIWLSPENASIMATNICENLKEIYPQYSGAFQSNLDSLLIQLEDLQNYGTEQLSDLSCRELITFHDGFSYFAESFNLEILKAIEEESGSEASAAEIIALIELVNAHSLPAVFTEVCGSDACAGIIQSETDVEIYDLDMAISGNSYFDAMYRNIDVIKEALS